MALEDQVTDQWQQLNELRSKFRSLNLGGGNGTLGGMDGWVQSVETRLAQLHADVRQILYAVIALAMIGAGVFWTGYTRIEDKLAAQAEKLSEIDRKLDVIIARPVPPARH